MPDYVKIMILVTIIGVVCVFLFVGYVYKKGKYKTFANKVLLNLICEAELQFGAKTGAIKNSYVFRTIYESMPAAFRLFVSADEVLDLIESALDEFKDYLAANSYAAASLGLDQENTQAIDTYDNMEGDSGND